MSYSISNSSTRPVPMGTSTVSMRTEDMPIEAFRTAFLDYLLAQGHVNPQTQLLHENTAIPLPLLNQDTCNDILRKILQKYLILHGRKYSFSSKFNIGALLRYVMNRTVPGAQVFLVGSALPWCLDTYFDNFAQRWGITRGNPLYQAARNSLKQEPSDIDIRIELPFQQGFTKEQYEEGIRSMLYLIQKFLFLRSNLKDDYPDPIGIDIVNQNGLDNYLIKVDNNSGNSNTENTVDRYGIISFAPKDDRQVDILVYYTIARDSFSVHEALRLPLLPLLCDQFKMDRIRPASSNPDLGWQSLVDRIMKTIRILRPETLDPFLSLPLYLNLKLKGYKPIDATLEGHLLHIFVNAARQSREHAKAPTWYKKAIRKSYAHSEVPCWIFPLAVGLQKMTWTHHKNHPKAFLAMSILAVNCIEAHEGTKNAIPHFWREVAELRKADSQAVETMPHMFDWELIKQNNNPQMALLLAEMDSAIGNFPSMKTPELWILAKSAIPERLSQAFSDWKSMTQNRSFTAPSDCDKICFHRLKSIRPDLAVQMITEMLKQGLDCMIALQMAVELIDDHAKHVREQRKSQNASGSEPSSSSSQMQVPSFDRITFVNNIVKYTWSRHWGGFCQALFEAMQQGAPKKFPVGTIENLWTILLQEYQNAHIFEICHIMPLAQRKFLESADHSRIEKLWLYGVQMYIHNGINDIAERLWNLGHKEGVFLDNTSEEYKKIVFSFAGSEHTSANHMKRLLALPLHTNDARDAASIVHKFLQAKKEESHKHVKLIVAFFTNRIFAMDLESRRHAALWLLRDLSSRIRYYPSFVRSTANAYQNIRHGKRPRISEGYLSYYYVINNAQSRNPKQLNIKELRKIVQVLKAGNFKNEASDITSMIIAQNGAKL